MEWQFTPLVVVYGLSAVLAFSSIAMVGRLHQARGAKALISLMAFIGIWALTDMVQHASGNQTVWLILNRINLFAAYGTIISWAFFALIYTQNEHWLTPLVRGILIGIPAFLYIFVLTWHLNGLYYTSYDFVYVDGTMRSARSYGPMFYAWVGYGYTVLFGGALLMLRTAIRSPELFRGQSVMVIMAAALPMVVNIASLVGLNPIAPSDPSSVAFTASAIFLAVAINRYRFLNVFPVAHDLVFRSVKNAVIIISLSDEVLDINPAAEQLFGHQRNEVVGKHIAEAYPEHIDTLRQFANATEVSTEIILNERSYDLHIMPVTDRRDSTSARLVMLYDITERKQTLEELEAYAHSVAHDLKNPLASIRSRAQLLTTPGITFPPEEQAKYLTRIEAVSHNMADTIDALLLLASIRQQNDIPLSPVNLETITKRVMERLATVIEDADATIITPDSYPTPISYAPWLEEILANYVSNAVKYGGTPPEITIGTTTSNNNVIVWVKDNGEGMTPEQQSQVFDQFARLKKHARIDGHGLGLSIVRRIARRLDISVDVESARGEGSRFSMELPIARPEQSID